MTDPVRFQNRNLMGAVFNDVNLGEARFTNVNLRGARFNDVNLSNVVIDNANVEGLTIYGYDIHALLQAQLEKADRERKGR